ncbi:uncharacterized protein LOC142178173 [Nicotiana tabacum]|uniref:Uncharacterized protein LOC142178173 n=1 Tax=Nicotiana tabacum TaxID=4097 RepID=A0AC58U294_TOBAC
MGAKFKRYNYVAQIFLQQRSKATWLRLGDENTRYFLSVIKHRKLTQAVTQLHDGNSHMQYDPNLIADIFVQFHKRLQGDHRRKTSSCFLRNGHKLTIMHQLELLDPHSKKDVKDGMMSIYVNKSPEPDGFGSGFFKHAWNIVGGDTSEAVLVFLRNDKLLK